jgi:hypothetical protein
LPTGAEFGADIAPAFSDDDHGFGGLPALQSAG